jgi:hypothetical protein
MTSTGEQPQRSDSPKAGESLPRGAEAFGVRVKLAKYSLDVNHKDGGPKARGFERILGITIEDIDYLEGAIYTGVVLVPVSEVRDNTPWGIKCTVIVPVRGLGAKSGRIVDVRTVWQFYEPGGPPRLVSAYIDS